MVNSGGSNSQPRKRQRLQPSTSSVTTASSTSVPQLVPTGEVHLSLSRPFALRAHQLQPFGTLLKSKLQGVAKPFCCEVASSYDVLVNDDRTRSFLW
jgi:Uncharacterised conserved protein